MNRFKHIFCAIVGLLICMQMSNGQGIIMGSQAIVNNIADDPIENFYDPGGIPGYLGANNEQHGYFANNLKDTMTLKTNIGASRLYILFSEFSMGYGDTLWIYDGETTASPLIGFYNSVHSPEEITATGRALTFVFHSDNISDVGELSLGWQATTYAYLTNPQSCSLTADNNGMTWMTCNAKFYDSGGATGNIASNNENNHAEFTSPIGSHIKMAFTSFSVNGILKIYDGQYNDPNKRLIGQFCTSTLDASTSNRPPVLFSSGSSLTVEYVGASGDNSKSGWAADVSCVADLFESPDGSACPSISILSADTSVSYIEHDCANPINILDAKIVATGHYTNDYTVKSIPFASHIFAFNQGTSIGASADDSWQSSVSLPFTFTFFGQDYTHVYPGTNGLISMSSQSGYCQYAYPAPPTTPPYTSIPYIYKNCIYGVFEDIDCRYFINNGAVRTGVLGTTPCRAFVFNYQNVGLYGHNSSGNDWYNTYQMVIYEGTNIIDVFVQHRKCCATTNSSNHEGIIGLQNNTSSQILIAPGRGMSGWEADNEGWRFTPITPLDENATLTWYENSVDDAHIVGTTKRLVVSPQVTTNYIVKYHFTNGGGNAFDLMDTVMVHVSIPQVTATNNSGTATCPGEAVALNTTIAPNNFGITPTHYAWSSGDTTANCTVYPQQTGTYTVTVTYSNGCTSTASSNVTVTEMERPVISGDSTICQGFSTTLTATHPTSTTFTWNTGAHTPAITVSPSDTTDYIVDVTLTGNCHTTDTFRVYVWPHPTAGFYATPTDIYVQNGIGTVTCTNTSSPDVSLHWNFGDIYSPENVVTGLEQPSHDYTHAGYYTITLSVQDTNGCQDSIYTRVSVTVPYFFYIPNAFTPNGDGTNERFAPQGEGVDPANYSMMIFDRFGGIVFKTTNPYDYWDGFSRNGGKCPTGSYAYLIRLKTLNGDDKEYTGTVTLIR